MFLQIVIFYSNCMLRPSLFQAFDSAKLKTKVYMIKFVRHQVGKGHSVI